MEALSSTLAAAATQSQLGTTMVKLAAQDDQQMAAMLSQVARSGQALASNPAHLGQSLDTYA
ncbi:MAG: putative motility protein [Gallionellaceae bacterium]|nr:putative motility protein [Gallionellaceae bacterium]MDD5365380.1 putative motility protein [Gallionellaceae bacterium]